MTRIALLSVFLAAWLRCSSGATIPTTVQPDREPVHNFKDFEDYLLLDDMEETFAERAKRHSRWDEAGNGQGNNIEWEREKDNMRDPAWMPKIEPRHTTVRDLERSGRV